MGICFFSPQILSGSLTEVRFAWPEKSEIDETDGTHEMHQIGEKVYKSNEVAYINGKYG